jgi:alpha-beta hydrolase superfamily lysophospholipase
MRRRVTLITAALLVAASGLAAAPPQDVSFRTDDGVTIAASLYLPSKPGPGVILLHMLTRTRADWQPLASRLSDAGFVALAIDLRGHGASDPQPDGSGPTDLGGMVADVRAARAYLATRREAIPGRVGIAGASIGANLAILYAATDPTVRSLVLLSPGIDFRGLRPEAAMRKYGDRPALLAASQEDNYATASTRQLAAPGPGTRDVRILSGAGHGTSMLVRQPDLVGSLVDWFRRTLL